MARPLILLSIRRFLSILPSPSAAMMNTKGDNGSPYLIPRELWKGEVGELLTKTEKKAEDSKFMAHLFHWSENPNTLSIPTKNSQFSLS